VAAAAIVAASNVIVLREVASRTTTNQSKVTSVVPRRLTVAMMPKNKGNAYFIACRKGAEEAAKELGIELIWDGPTDTDPAKQNEIVEAWITRGVDVIAVAGEKRVGIFFVLFQGPAPRNKGR